MGTHSSAFSFRRAAPRLAAAGLAGFAAAMAAGAGHAEPSVQPAVFAGPAGGEIRLLIGGDVAAAPAEAPVVRLGPADADWSEPDQPIGLPMTELRGANGRIIWSLRRATPTVMSGPLAHGRPGDSLSCLTQAVYYEARSQSLEGQEGVAQVVMNRSHIPGYGGSVCGAVYQRTERTCQFTFVCDGSMNRLIQPGAWRKAQEVASQALGGFVYDPLKQATHYHADYVTPSWSYTRERVMQIGAHIFYR